MGGYSLAKNPSEISIADIMEGLDKSKSLVSCLYNSDICVIWSLLTTRHVVRCRTNSYF